MTEPRLNAALGSMGEDEERSPLSETQEAILQAMETLWKQVPDQRMGQLLENYAFGHFLTHPEGQMLRVSDEIALRNLRSVLGSE